jgi:hypothetical protein
MERLAATPRKVFSERVGERVTIYLDTNAWSDLSEGRTDDAREALKLALRAHSRGLAIFPLACATVTEVLKREVNVASRHQSDVMDALSSGVILRNDAPVRDLEVLCAYRFLIGEDSRPNHGDEMFTLTCCYEKDCWLQLPDGYGEAKATAAVAKLTAPCFPAMRWLQDSRRTPEFLDRQATTDVRYVSEITRKIKEAQTWAVDGSGRPNKNTLRFAEHKVVWHTIKQSLRRLVGLQGFERVAQNLDRVVKKSGASALRSIVETMPSIWLSCEMNVQRTLASGPTEKQDFYDHEHAALAVPYLHAFVSSDGGVFDVLRRARASDRYACRLVRGMSALRTLLETL